eukprot:GILI01045660.1.p1 GENE.GILI01045660.1~~GILI01045660.1.p1  ORF type:complete len:131 (-),score=8.73 GILI01045660.1:209-601(-)
MTSRTYRIRIRCIDGAQGEFDACPLTTVSSLMNTLYQDRILQGGSSLHRYPKSLIWNTINLCDRPDMTLADISFDEDGAPIEFVPFGSVEEMFEAAMARNLSLETQLYRHKKSGDSLNISVLEFAEKKSS